MSADNKLRIGLKYRKHPGRRIGRWNYADTPSEFMVVGPTKFTIPGLWAGQ